MAGQYAGTGECDQSAIIRAESEIIEAKDLPERFQQPELSLEKMSRRQAHLSNAVMDYLKIKVAVIAIEDCSGNGNMPARNLNVSPASLDRFVHLSEGFDRRPNVA